MSEERSADTGQFTPSTDGLFGRDHELVQAGYKPMPDPEREEEATFDTAREAADALNVPAEEPAEPIIYYDKQTGEPTDPNEAITVEQAARDLTAYHDAKADDWSKSISADFAAEVDKMRADALKQNPKLAEHYGIEPPAAEVAKTDVEQVNKQNIAEVAAEPANDGLDPELSRALKHPQVRQAIEEQLGEAHKAREAYSSGLETTRVHTLATLAEVVPHLAGLSPQQFEQGLAVLAEVDPPRFQTAMNILGRAHTIAQAQQQDQQRQAYAAQQRFQEYGKAEDARFRAMVDSTPAKMQETVTEMAAYASELGIERDQLVHLFQTEPIMRHAAFQKMMYDATQFRLHQKAAIQARKAVPKDLPPVQRPGTSRPSSTQSDKTQALEARFNRSGSVKDAAELYALRSRASA